MHVKLKTQDDGSSLVCVSMMGAKAGISQTYRAIRDKLPRISEHSNCYTDHDTYPGQLELYFFIPLAQLDEVLADIEADFGADRCALIKQKLEDGDESSLWGD